MLQTWLLPLVKAPPEVVVEAGAGTVVVVVVVNVVVVVAAFVVVVSGAFVVVAGAPVVLKALHFLGGQFPPLNVTAVLHSSQGAQKPPVLQNSSAPQSR